MTIPSITSTDHLDITGRGRVWMVTLEGDRQLPPTWLARGSLISFNGVLSEVCYSEYAVGLGGYCSPKVGVVVSPISVISTDSWVVDMTTRGGPRLRVYSTTNPREVSNREALNYLIGQTVLVDDVPKVVHSVESFCVGGTYAAGRAIGLAVEESL